MPQFYFSDFRSESSPRKLFIAIPVTRGLPPALSKMLWEAKDLLWNAGIDAALCQLDGNPHVDDSRNLLVREFLKTTAQEFLFIDDDVYTAAKNIVKLAQANRPVVAGLYRFKTDEKDDFPWRQVADYPNVIEADGCMKVDNVPTGLLKIQRHVLAQLWAKEPKFWGSGEDPATCEPIRPLFERKFFTINGRNQRLGGDYAFGQKWKEAGGEVYVIPVMQTVHIGSKHYSGDFSMHLAKISNQDHHEFTAAVRQLKGGTSDDQTFAKIYHRQTNKWALSPEGLAALWFMAKDITGNILETGSGLSTLVLGIAADLTGGHVHVLEHDMYYFRMTFSLLQRYGIENVTMHYAPLRIHSDGVTYYEIPDVLPDNFTLAVNDGPQHVHGRTGFYTILRDRVEDSIWFVDDADREKDLFMKHIENTGREFKQIGQTGVRSAFISTPPNRLETSTAA